MRRSSGFSSSQQEPPRPSSGRRELRKAGSSRRSLRLDWVNVQTRQGPSPARGLLPLSLPILPAESHTYWTSLACGSALPPGINFLSALTPVALGTPKVLPYKKMPTYRSAGHDCHPLPSLETSWSPLSSPGIIYLIKGIKLAFTFSR